MSNSDLTGPSRANTWRVELLDLAGTSVGDLDMSAAMGLPGVQPGASFDRDANSDLRESGELAIVRTVQQALDWTQQRVRLWYTGTGADPLTPLSTLVPTAAPETHKETHVAERVEMHSTLSLLSSDGPGGMYGVAAGVNGAAKLTEILNATVGAGAFMIDASDVVLNASLTWNADTSWLTICNKIATAIGFFALKPDPWGRILATKYVDPGSRPTAYTFDDGAHTGLYMPGWTRDRDLLMPNRVVCIQKVEGDDTPIEAEATLPDSHPRSAANVGRVITKTYPDQDFATEAAGLILAESLLASLVPSETRVFSHPWLPNVQPGAVVVHQRAGLPDMRGVVQSQSVKLGVGGLFETTVRGLL